MYESPIELVHRHINGMREEIDKKTGELIVKSCMEIGININREELVRMAQYDRGRYEKGYTDGKTAGAVEVLEKLLKSIDDHMANIVMADTEGQSIYMMGQRHIKDIVEIYLKKYNGKSETEEDYEED